eukprot:748713_1
MAIFNFGIYLGFSTAYGIGNYLTEQYSWRYAWYAFGYSGGAIALLIFCLPRYREPIKPFREISDVDTMDFPRVKKRRGHKKQVSEADIDFSSNDIMDSNGTAGSSFESDVDSFTGQLTAQQYVTIKSVIKYYAHSPSLFILLLASLYRNCGGYVWGYQANNFLENEKGQSSKQIASWLGWIPAVAGSMGCLFGGALSDRLATKYGKGSNDTQFIQSTVIIRIWV